MGLAAVGAGWLRRIGPARGLGAALGLLVGSGLRVRRAHVEAAMQRAGLAAPAGTARAMYAALGRGLFELLALGLGGGRAEVRVPDTVWRALEGGAVVATAHTGNWDVVACGVAARRPLTVVTKHLSQRALDAVWQGIRRARGVRLVSSGHARLPVAQALARGELVAMLVDQAPERARAVTEAPFLGAPALVDLVPALTAMRARVPLAAVFPVRLPDGSHSVHLAGVYSPPPRPSRAWAVATMCDVTRLLDAHVRAHPEQWLWMHRRWKGAPSRELARPAAALAGAGP